MGTSDDGVRERAEALSRKLYRSSVLDSDAIEAALREERALALEWAGRYIRGMAISGMLEKSIADDLDTRAREIREGR